MNTLNAPTFFEKKVGKETFDLGAGTSACAVLTFFENKLASKSVIWLRELMQWLKVSKETSDSGVA